MLSRLVHGDGVLFTILWLPLAILLPIGVAAGLHVWVEGPALRRGRAMAQAAMDGGGGGAISRTVPEGGAQSAPSFRWIDRRDSPQS